LSLAETYLSGPYAGVAEFLVRGHGASIHGIETAFLATTVDQFDPVTGINMPTPVLHDAPTLAFTLMGIPLALENAFRAVASSVEWPAAGKTWRTWDRDSKRLIDTWTSAVNAVSEDEAGPAALEMFDIAPPEEGGAGSDGRL
jgi:hypothetical protein